MLVLSRKMNERVVIGSDPEIVLTIVKVDRNQVRIGIDAPPEVAIQREELVGDSAKMSRSDRTPSRTLVPTG